MQCGILDWILAQEKGRIGKKEGNPNQLYSLVNSIIPSECLSLDKCAMIIEDVNIMGNWMEGIQDSLQREVYNTSVDLTSFQNTSLKRKTS